MKNTPKNSPENISRKEALKTKTKLALFKMHNGLKTK